MIDLDPLHGLRSFVVVHVVIYDTMLLLDINLNGAAQLPFLYLIAGYTLALGDGRTRWARMPCCAELIPRHPVDIPPRMDARSFYWRCFCHTAPTYYVCNILSLPLSLLGVGWTGPPDLIVLCYLCTATATTTWFGLEWIGSDRHALDEPLWFVSTIWFCYWCFPSVLPRLQDLKPSNKQAAIVILFLFQLAAVTILHRVFFKVDHYAASSVSTFWPPARLPVFLMGVLAGLLRLADAHAFQPYGLGWLVGLVDPGTASRDRTSAWWARCVDIEAALMAAVYLLTSVMMHLLRELQHFWPGEVYLQAVLPLSQLTLLNALTCDNRQSRLSYVLCNDIVLWMGKLSYSLFLVHAVVIGYTSLALNGPLARPVCEDNASGSCTASWDEFFRSRRIPPWSVLVIWPVSMVAAVLLCYGVEVPGRRYLQGMISHEQQPKGGTHVQVPPDDGDHIFPTYGAFDVSCDTTVRFSMNSACAPDNARNSVSTPCIYTRPEESMDTLAVHELPRSLVSSARSSLASSEGNIEEYTKRLSTSDWDNASLSGVHQVRATHRDIHQGD